MKNPILRVFQNTVTFVINLVMVVDLVMVVTTSKGMCTTSYTTIKRKKRCKVYTGPACVIQCRHSYSREALSCFLFRYMSDKVWTVSHTKDKLLVTTNSVCRSGLSKGEHLRS